MAKTIGQLVYAAASKGTSWGASVVETDFIPITSEAFRDEIAKLPGNTLTGKAGLRTLDTGPKTVSGAMEINAVYDLLESAYFYGIDMVLAAMMGAATYASTVNVMKFADDLAVFLNFAFRRSSTVAWEIVSAICKSWEIKGSVADGVSITAEWLCYDLLRSSTTITAANMLTNQPTKDPRRILFTDLTFQIASDFVNVLGTDSDKITISEFSLKCNNNLTDAEFGTPLDAGYTDGKLAIQPVRNGQREVTLDITLPRYDDADTYFAGYTGETPFQIEMAFDGPGTDYLKLFMPNAKLIAAEAPVSGPEALPEKATFRLMRGTDYNDGAGNTVMVDGQTTAIVDELVIETLNDRTAAPI